MTRASMFAWLIATSQNVVFEPLAFAAVSDYDDSSPALLSAGPSYQVEVRIDHHYHYNQEERTLTVGRRAGESAVQAALEFCGVARLGTLDIARVVDLLCSRDAPDSQVNSFSACDCARARKLTHGTRCQMIVCWLRRCNPTTRARH